MRRLSKTDRAVLLDLYGELHTSNHTREYVRLSGAGLVDLRKSWLHKHSVSLTAAGRAKARELALAELPRLRAEGRKHMADNPTMRACVCGSCVWVRTLDKDFRGRSLAWFQKAPPVSARRENGR